MLEEQRIKQLQLEAQQKKVNADDVDYKGVKLPRTHSAPLLN